MNAYLPWLGPEAAPSEIWIVANLPVASRDDVDRCMHCSFPDCRNCMGAKGQRREHDSAGRPPVCDIEHIRRMVNAGKSNREICEELGCSKSTASRYRRKIVISA